MSKLHVSGFWFLVSGLLFRVRMLASHARNQKLETRNQKPETLNSEVLSVACARQSPILSLSSERNA